MAGSKQERTPPLDPRVDNFLEETIHRFFPEGPQEAAWDQFMGVKRTKDDMVALLREDVDPQYQQRALQVLFAPDITKLPFLVSVDAENSHGNLGLFISYISYGRDADENKEGRVKRLLGKLSKEQANFVASKLPDYVKETEKAVKTIEVGIEEKGTPTEEERMAIINLIGRYATSLKTYNMLIPHLLTALDTKQAEELFAHFTIHNHPISSEYIESVLRMLFGFDIRDIDKYKPLSDLYDNTSVDESWKRKAANKMHEIIHEEEKNQNPSSPNGFHTAYSYAVILGSMTNDRGELPVSKEFYLKELEFILTTNEPILVDSFLGNRTLRMLEGDLKRKFLIHQIKGNAFIIYDNKDVQLVEGAIKEFSDDLALTTTLRKMLEAWRNEKNKTKREKQVARRIKLDALKAMKKT
ncbi:MAG: hypothetical protein Q7R31_00850 [Candidatus Levybacteria bacterium]|nr:hypothetical protein [Candidatus Levybacteria bacterium]